MTATAEKRVGLVDSVHINSTGVNKGMDLDKSHYEETWRSEDGLSAVFHKKPEYCPPERQREIMENFSEAYYSLFDSLTPMDKFKIFEEDGCVALVDGEWQEVDREYYIKALGLEGQVE